MRRRKKGSGKGRPNRPSFFSSSSRTKQRPRLIRAPRGEADRDVVLNNRARRRIKGRPEQDIEEEKRKEKKKKELAKERGKVGRREGITYHEFPKVLLPFSSASR